MNPFVLVVVFAILFFLIGMFFKALKFLIVIALVLTMVAMVMRSIQKGRRAKDANKDAKE